MTSELPPLLRTKRYDEPSRFQVENLLREARRQRHLPDTPVPDVCLLDPDGDVVRHLSETGEASRDPAWACYHSELWITDRPHGSLRRRAVCAVGAPYAVLVAEELHASGCRLVVSVTSAGQIVAIAEPPYFVLIEQAWRDEGTSLHYLPPGEWSHLRPELLSRLDGAFDGLDEPVVRGKSWTTDAPLRETDARDRGRRVGWYPRGRDGSGRSLRIRRPRANETSFASPTSPTPWQRKATTSRRATTTAPIGSSRLSTRSHASSGDEQD